MLPLRHMRRFLLVVAIGVFCVTGVVFAEGGVTSPAGGVTSPAGGVTAPGGGITLPDLLACTGAPAGTSPILCVLGKILTVLLKISIPITTIMVLVGAFQILTAAGDPEKFKTGRKTILYAVAGFSIVFFASSVVPILQSIFK